MFEWLPSLPPGDDRPGDDYDIVKAVASCAPGLMDMSIYGSAMRLWQYLAPSFRQGMTSDLLLRYSCTILDSVSAAIGLFYLLVTPV